MFDKSYVPGGRCNLAFVADTSPLVRRLLQDPNSATMHKNPNLGVILTHGPWTLVPVSVAAYRSSPTTTSSSSFSSSSSTPLPKALQLLPKWSPSSFFVTKVAVYVDPRVVFEDITLVLQEFKKSPPNPSSSSSSSSSNTTASTGGDDHVESATGLLVGSASALQNKQRSEQRVFRSVMSSVQEAAYRMIRIAAMDEMMNGDGFTTNLDTTSFVVHRIMSSSSSSKTKPGNAVVDEKPETWVEDDTRLFRCDVLQELLQWDVPEDEDDAMSLQFVMGLHDMWSRIIAKKQQQHAWWTISNMKRKQQLQKREKESQPQEQKKDQQQQIQPEASVREDSDGKIDKKKLIHSANKLAKAAKLANQETSQDEEDNDKASESIPVESDVLANENKNDEDEEEEDEPLKDAKAQNKGGEQPEDLDDVALLEKDGLAKDSEKLDKADAANKAEGTGEALEGEQVKSKQEVSSEGGPKDESSNAADSPNEAQRESAAITGDTKHRRLLAVQVDGESGKDEASDMFSWGGEDHTTGFGMPEAIQEAVRAVFGDTGKQDSSTDDFAEEEEDQHAGQRQESVGKAAPHGTSGLGSFLHHRSQLNDDDSIWMGILSSTEIQYFCHIVSSRQVGVVNLDDYTNSRSA